MHPQTAPPTLSSGTASPSTLGESAAQRGVGLFPNGSARAPGLSGLRPSHLHKAVFYSSSDQENRALVSLTRFVNPLVAGFHRLPSHPTSLWCLPFGQ